MRIPDPQLNYHADRYIAQRISAHGITFEQYLSDTPRFDTLALEPEPLLPAQRAVAKRLASEVSAAIADGRFDYCAHCGGDSAVPMAECFICPMGMLCRGQGGYSSCIGGHSECPCAYCCCDD